MFFGHDMNFIILQLQNLSTVCLSLSGALIATAILQGLGAIFLLIILTKNKTNKVEEESEDQYIPADNKSNIDIDNTLK